MDDLYNVVLPVRFALLREQDPEMYEWLGQYMDHTEQRHQRQPALGRSTERMAALVAACVPAVTPAEAVRCIGILFTNCFELNVDEMRARALYPLVSLVNHSCVPNMQHTNLIQAVRGEEVGGMEGDIVVMQLEAARTILPGTQLTIRYNYYTQVFRDTLHCTIYFTQFEFGFLSAAHRIKDDRMENSIKGRQIGDNLRKRGGCARAVQGRPPPHSTPT